MLFARKFRMHRYDVANSGCTNDGSNRKLAHSHSQHNSLLSQVSKMNESLCKQNAIFYCSYCQQVEIGTALCTLLHCYLNCIHTTIPNSRSSETIEFISWPWLEFPAAREAIKRRSLSHSSFGSS